MNTIKRWAFLPLLLLITIALANQLLAPGQLGGSLGGWLLGIGAAIPLAILWDRHRQRAVYRRVSGKRF